MLNLIDNGIVLVARTALRVLGVLARFYVYAKLAFWLSLLTTGTVWSALSAVKGLLRGLL